MDPHAKGLALVFLSAVAFSTAGFFARLIPLDPWTLLFWRGWFAGLFIAVVIVIQQRRRTWSHIRAIGWPGIAVATASTIATIFFINAFRWTSVADVVIILATGPFVTAALGWLWLGLRETRATLAASTVALLGVLLMVQGGAGSSQLIGDLFALAVTVCMAVMMLIVRRHAGTPMLPAACLSALLCPLVVWPVAAPAAVTPPQLLDLLLFGTMQFGMGLLLLTLGGRLISATEGALVGTLETPLAVLWVWLAFGESPGLASLIGGAIVMAAVAAHIRQATRSAPLPSRRS